MMLPKDEIKKSPELKEELPPIEETEGIDKCDLKDVIDKLPDELLHQIDQIICDIKLTDTQKLRKKMIALFVGKICFPKIDTSLKLALFDSIVSTIRKSIN